MRGWISATVAIAVTSPGCVPWGSLKAQEPRSATAAPQCARPGNINVVVDDRKRAALIKLMNQMVEKKIAPGVVMMVEQRGRPVIAIKTGFADAEAKAPMREDTLFRVYSMTKPLTSVAAMQLIEAGRLSLADPVSKYIPEFRTTRVAATDDKLEALARPITVRDLMTHTAGMTYASAATDPVHSAYRKLGIPAGPGVDTLPADGSAPVRTTEELARRLALAPVLNQPGSRFTYGNASDVLGRVVEVAGGVRLRDVIAARITGPLGMSDSAFAVKPGDVARLSAAYVSPSQQAGKSEATLQTIDVATLGNGRLMRVDGGNTSIYLRASEIDYGGAGMISSAPDYLRFTQMLRQRGSLEGKRVLQAPSVDAMRLDQLAPEARSGSPMLGGLGFGYGFAVRLAPTADTPVFPRCGYFWGGAASTYFWVDPAGQTSGVMMTQVFGGDVRPYWLAAMRIIYAP